MTNNQLDQSCEIIEPEIPLICITDDSLCDLKDQTTIPEDREVTIVEDYINNNNTGVSGKSCCETSSSSRSENLNILDKWSYVNLKEFLSCPFVSPAPVIKYPNIIKISDKAILNLIPSATDLIIFRPHTCLLPENLLPSQCKYIVADNKVKKEPTSDGRDRLTNLPTARPNKSDTYQRKRIDRTRSNAGYFRNDPNRRYYRRIKRCRDESPVKHSTIAVKTDNSSPSNWAEYKRLNAKPKIKHEPPAKRMKIET